MAAVIVALASVAVGWPVFSSAGIPSLHHDWAWPIDVGQTHAQAVVALSAVLPDNFGSFNFYQFNAPFWVICDGLLRLFGSDPALRIFISLCVAAAGVAMFAFLRATFALERTPCVGAGILYGTNAIVANRLAAGHLTYLMAYAVFPIVLWQLHRIGHGKTASAWLILTTVIPLAIVHPQFIVFPVIAGLIMVGFVTPRRRPALLLAACLPLALSPFTLAVAVSGSPAHDLAFERTTIHWQLDNSAPWPQALDLSNSPYAYDQLAAPPLRQGRAIAMRVLWLLAIAGAVRSTRARPFFGLAVFGLLMQLGLRGPISPVLSWLYTSFESASVFRELYHFAVFAAVGMCVAAVHAGRRAGIAVAILAVISALPQYSGTYFHGITFRTDADIQAISRIISADPKPGYVAFLPMLQPVGPDAAHAGDDPQAFPFPNHASIHAFMPQAPLIQLDVALRHDPGHAAATLASFGVRYVVLRPRWKSYYETSQEPQFRRLLRRHPPIPQRIGVIARHMHIVFRGRETWLGRIENSAQLVHGPPLTLLRRLPTSGIQSQTVLVTDPREGWADALRWFWWSPATAEVVNPGAITVGRNVLAATFRGERAYAYAWAHTGATIYSGGESIPVRGEAFRAYPVIRGRLLVSANGVSGFGGIGLREQVAPTPPEMPSKCTIVGQRRRRKTITVKAGCPYATVEILANRSLGYTLRSGDRDIASYPTRWDAQFNVPSPGAELVNPLLARMRVFEWLQYGAWIVSAATGIALALRVAASLRRRRVVQGSIRTVQSDA